MFYENIDPLLNVVIFGFPAYFLLEIFLRRSSYPLKLEPPSNKFFPQWDHRKIWTLFVSPGYWLARYYKNKTKYFENKKCRSKARKEIVKTDNRNNWLISAVLFDVSCLAWSYKIELLMAILSGIVFWRYISRSFEISYAFARDVAQKEKNRTGLGKQARIRLALVSYAEIYLYSANFYLAFFPLEDGFKALLTSLNVGTLTNVGYVFSCPSLTDEWIAISVFVQVIATISLVVLSLASYISRGDKEEAVNA